MWHILAWFANYKFQIQFTDGIPKCIEKTHTNFISRHSPLIGHEWPTSTNRSFEQFLKRTAIWIWLVSQSGTQKARTAKSDFGCKELGNKKKTRISVWKKLLKVWVPNFFAFSIFWNMQVVPLWFGSSNVTENAGSSLFHGWLRMPVNHDESFLVVLGIWCSLTLFLDTFLG